MLHLLVLILFTASVYSDDHLIVKTTSGTLHGRESEVQNQRLKLFLGVPYSKAPVGNLRFKPPVAFHSENTFVEAHDFGPVCYQPPHALKVINSLLTPNRTKMSEDCLYLNIYAPVTDEQIPVMVWLPGEGFNYADPTQFDGRYLAATSKVIVVTVSYRVSVFGFLNALSKEAPGNVGLLDQRLALKWVQENIRAFGGDPERVTLFGRFTGAMSAAIHAFSPLSKQERLFKRIMLHSGVPDGRWVFDQNPLNAAISLAEAANCVNDKLNETIACLKRLPAEVLLKTALPIPNGFRPSVDYSLISKSTLSEAVNGDYQPVDILIGTNNDEGSLCLTALSVMNPERYELFINDSLSKKDFDQLINSFVLDIYKESNNLSNNLTSYAYSYGEPSSLRKKFVKFCGDLYIYSHATKLANIISKRKQNIFVYELSHRPSFSNNPNFIEAGHGDDVLYAFGLPLKIENLPEEEKDLTYRILGHLKNFAYNGNPNAANGTFWPNYQDDSHLIMRFDTHPDPHDVAKTNHEDAVDFWHHIIPAVLNHDCNLIPSPLTLSEEMPVYVRFFGSWLSITATEYMLTGLLCTSGFLLVSLLLSLIVIIRYSSSITFQRLK